MMRKILSICAALIVCGCQKNNDVAMPTDNELSANPQLLSEWKAKCDTGEYSHLPTNQKDKFCFTTHEAERSRSIIKAGNEEANFFVKSIRRKK